MQKIEEMLVKNGVVRAGNCQITGSLVHNSLAVYGDKGQLTHRIERSVVGDDIIVVDVKANRVVARAKVKTFMQAA